MRRFSGLVGLVLAAFVIGFGQMGSNAAVPATYEALSEPPSLSEPSEPQMRGAFERYLATLVSNTLVLVGQSGGREAVRKVQQNHNDQFEIRSFQKLQCHASPTPHDYLCDFVVEVAVVTGTFRRSLQGHFVDGANGLDIADAH